MPIIRIVSGGQTGADRGGLKPTGAKWRWRPGTVSQHGEHIRLAVGDDNIPVARIAPPADRTFAVEFLMDDKLPSNSKALKAAKRELDFYLVGKEEPDPWAYAIYHCTTASSLYSRIHWAYFPKGLRAMGRGSEG